MPLSRAVTSARGAAPAGALAAAAAVTTAGVLPVFLTGALAVQVRADLGFDPSELGLTVAVFFSASALLSAAGGRLAEWLGPTTAMRVAAGTGAASLFSVAVFAHHLQSLLLCLVVGGAANALGQPASNLFLARRVAPDRLGLAFGVKQAAIPLATLLGGAAVPAVALTVGWRWAYAGGAALAMAVAIAVRGGGDEQVVRRGGRRGAGDAALRPLVLLGLGAGLGASAAGALGAFLVSAAVDAGMEEGAAGLLASACSIVGASTRLGLGVRADRHGGGGQLAVVATMLAAGALTYLLLASGSLAAIVVGGLTGYAVAWGWPGLLYLAIVRNSPGAPAAATGITQSGTFLGGVVGPLLFGSLVDGASYAMAWSVSAGLSLCGAAAVWSARRAMRADRERRGV